MSREQEIRNLRLEKINRLEEAGMEAFPAEAKQDETLHDARTHFLRTKKKRKNGAFNVCGRIMSVRGAGKIMFVKLFDGTGDMQMVLRVDDLGAKKMKFFAKNFDAGDFVQFRGKLGVTKTKEKSMFISSYKMLTKSLLPLPDEHYGLQDEETRYRKRYLDILLNKDIRSMLERKAQFWQSVRSLMLQEGFMEVETPTIETTTGGAEASPFKTHHNDFNLDVFMRISVGELWQKRLLAGGFPKTFEIGRVYRNEGSSPEHLQEFTNCEFYWSYANYKDGMKLVRKMYIKIAKEVYGTTKFTTRGHTFDLAKPWKEIDYYKHVKKVTGIDIMTATEKEMKQKLKELEVVFDGDNRERLMDTLWKYCRKKISGPAFLVNHPKIVSPLAKPIKGNEEFTQRFQPILAGSEVGNGFSELNDPIDQQERFELQQELIDRGDDEAMMSDDEFIEMLEHGMPPACGFGFGERLFAFFEDMTARETQTFPMVKPEIKVLSKKEAEAKYRSKKIVVIANPKAGYGVTANAIGQLGIEIGGFTDTDMFDITALPDKDGVRHYPDALYPMANLAGTQKQMAEFYVKCVKAGVQVFDFSDIMRKAHTDREMQEGYKAVKTKDIGYIAVGAVVPADFEKEWLGKLKLFG